MFYKANQPSLSVHDWIAMHTDAIPTEALAELYPYGAEDDRELRRLDIAAESTDCEPCDGDGWTGDDVFCDACDGTGEVDPDEDARELHAYPAAHGVSWRVDNRDEIRDAAIAAGFVVYEADDGPLHGSLILCVDGGGYSFTGQHWIPLRAELARQQCQTNEDPVAWGFIRVALWEAADREGDAERFDRAFPPALDGGVS